MDPTIQTQERAQYAWIGVALIMTVVMVASAVMGGEWWQWLILGAPVSIILSAITRLRRIRATGHPD